MRSIMTMFDHRKDSACRAEFHAGENRISNFEIEKKKKSELMISEIQRHVITLDV